MTVKISCNAHKKFGCMCLSGGDCLRDRTEAGVTSNLVRLNDELFEPINAIPKDSDSEIIKTLVDENEVKIVKGKYDVVTGVVTWIP